MKLHLGKLLVLLGFALASAAANAVVTLTVTPESVAPGGSVTATWSGIPSPAATNWLGLYTPAAGHASYISYRYTNGAASGSLPFTIPASVAPGTYQLRLFASNVNTLLAISNNFTVSIMVSGTVTLGGSPLAGVAFAASNGGTCTTSNASGQYSCAVLQPWSGTVTPSLSGYFFTPASRSYSNVTTSQTAQNYAATVAVQVSGRVTAVGASLAGVAFAASNGGICTASDASGQYSCAVPQGWSGSVTPSLASYAFTPASRSYSNVTANQPAQDYAAVTVQVSGTVTVGALPLGGVVFAATGFGSCTSSNASGQYNCTVPQGWSGSVTPSLTGYSFTPTSRSHSNLASNLPGQDFAATAGGGATAIYYIHADHLNTPRMITNQTLQVVWRWDQQEPFGVNVPDENPSGLGAFDLPLRLPGQYFDKETNLHYNYFRDYDAGIGRYIQSDPIGLEGGIGTYSYVLGDPLSLVDLLGLYTTEELANIIFNETQSLSGPSLSAAQVAIGQIAINREVPGSVDPGIASSSLNATSARALRNGAPSVVQAYNSATQAAGLALCKPDMTSGAKGFVLKGNPSKVLRYGRYPVLQQFGPFNNSFPTVGNANVPRSQQLPATGVYINTFAR